MRTNPTEAEKRIWLMLRDRRLSSFKFRRQQIIFPYIVDFVCLEQRLIIEADGSQHADNKQDARRDAFLRAQDFQLLRFWNNEVLAEADAVATAIYAALTPLTLPSATRSAVPLPQRGEGR
jgi:very-short-patch-repair endonuclease